MIRSEEFDLREGLVYDPYVKAYDSNFWKGDTANSVFDTGKNVITIGDTGLVGAITSYSQYLYGDFEFTIKSDSLSPDSNDSVKFFGLLNPGDTLRRGAAFFDMSFDSSTGADTTIVRPFRAVIYSETGTRQRKNITWDTLWVSGNTSNPRFRIKWESDGYRFLVNDTVYATLGDRPDSANSTFQINTSIPQAIRLVNRSLDTTDCSCTSLSLLNIRNARKVI